VHSALLPQGTSLETLLSKIRFSVRTFIAIETIDGEVLGSFTSSPWRRNGSTFYGSGETFLWRLAQPRRTPPCNDNDSLSTTTTACLEKSEAVVEIFRWSGANRNIQLLNSKMLAVGGGEPDDIINERLTHGVGGTTAVMEQPNRCWDFGLTLRRDLQSGSTGNCATFDACPNGRLSCPEHFEVLKIEVWTLSPTKNITLASSLEHSLQFATPLFTGDEM